MSPALQHFLASASYVGRLVFCIFVLYKTWPRKRHWVQGFKKLTPAGIPVAQMPGYNFRSRLVVCAFMSVALCLVLGSLFRRTFLPPAPPQAVTADPAPAPPPKIARSSTARDGDVVKIVCGGGPCAVAVTDQDAVKLDKGQTPSEKVFYVKNGTKAIVTGYDPQDTGSDTADVFIVAGADATSITLGARSTPEEHGCIPGRWMHKLQSQKTMTIYQLQGKGTP